MHNANILSTMKEKSPQMWECGGGGGGSISNL
jgi:hypothetical protein